MYSIQNTKEVLDFAFAGAGAVKSAMADGKISLEDLGYLMPVVMTAGPAFQDLGKVPKELGDLSEEEAKEVLEYASSKLGVLITDPQLKVKIDKALKVALALAEFLAVL